MRLTSSTVCFARTHPSSDERKIRACTSSGCPVCYTTFRSSTRILLCHRMLYTTFRSCTDTAGTSGAMRSGNRRLNSGVPPRQPGRSRHRPGSTSVSSFRTSSTRSKETKATFSNTEVGGRADLVRAGHMLARREYMHQTGRTSCTSGHLPCLASHRIAWTPESGYWRASLYDVSRPAPPPA